MGQYSYVWIERGCEIDAERLKRLHERKPFEWLGGEADSLWDGLNSATWADRLFDNTKLHGYWWTSCVQMLYGVADSMTSLTEDPADNVMGLHEETRAPAFIYFYRKGKRAKVVAYATTMYNKVRWRLHPDGRVTCVGGRFDERDQPRPPYTVFFDGPSPGMSDAAKAALHAHPDGQLFSEAELEACDHHLPTLCARHDFFSGSGPDLKPERVRFLHAWMHAIFSTDEQGYREYEMELSDATETFFANLTYIDEELVFSHEPTVWYRLDLFRTGNTRWCGARPRPLPHTLTAS